MLADGYEPAYVARVLGVDVRSLNGLRDSILARDLDPRELHLMGYRNAMVLYWRSRERLDRLAAALPTDPEALRKHSAWVSSVAQIEHRTNAHLKLALEHLQALERAGVSVEGDLRGLRLILDGTELGDYPSRVGEVTGDGDDDGDDE